MNRKHFFYLLLIIVFFGISGMPAYAQKNKGISLIRDTEIETFLKNWAKPTITAADLNPEAVHFILVQNNSLNAFVAGGQNIFIFTGLLRRTENACEVMGVIAHELGHIRGGHLVRTRDALKNASYESLLGTIAGIGAAILTGDGGAAAAISLGTQSAAARHFMAFSRVQESSADQAALNYMAKAGMNPQGLVTFMQKLESEELLPASQQSEYVRTHPLTRNRVEALKAGYERSAHREKPCPPAWQEQHDRMVAKLVGFISPEQVIWNYDMRDNTLSARYARTIADYRRDEIDKALKGIDDLLNEEPHNPYFQELKGQMLVDFGRVKEALPWYRRSVETLPGAALIRIAYAHVLIESAGNNRAQLKEAIDHLDRAAKDEPRSTRTHRLLATAHGRLGHEPLAKLHLAEEALLKGQTDYAKRLAMAALEGLEKGTPARLRAQDILSLIEINNEDSVK